MYGEILTTITINQNVHLHPLAGARYPPTTGANVGPNSGPRIYVAIANPRFSAGTISAIDPAPMVIGQEPGIPASKRNTIRAPRLLDTAHAMLKMRNRMAQTMYRILRPYISERGAMTMGPKA